MNEVDVGVALVDQGASRSVMRRSAYDRVKHRMSKQSQLVPVRNMYVVGSTNEYIPVLGAFMADLYTRGQQLISHTLIYVADDKKDNDIVRPSARTRIDSYLTVLVCGYTWYWSVSLTRFEGC